MSSVKNEELSVEEGIGRYMLMIIEADLTIEPMFSEIRKMIRAHYLRPYRDLALAKNPSLSTKQLSWLLNSTTAERSGGDALPFLVTHPAMTPEVLQELVKEADNAGMPVYLRSMIYLSAMMSPLSSNRQKRRFARESVRLYSAQSPNAHSVLRGRAPSTDPTSVVLPAPLLSAEDLDLIIKAAGSGHGDGSDRSIYHACLSHPNVSFATRWKAARRKDFWGDRRCCLSAVASNPSLSADEMMDILIHVRSSDQVLESVALPLAQNPHTFNLLLEEIHRLAAKHERQHPHSASMIIHALMKNPKYLDLKLDAPWESLTTERKVTS